MSRKGKLTHFLRKWYIWSPKYDTLVKSLKKAISVTEVQSFQIVTLLLDRGDDLLQLYQILLEIWYLNGKRSSCRKKTRVSPID